ncbi:MAG: hypothetical protein WC521_04475 [Bdellovibrionales bacterium]
MVYSRFENLEPSLEKQPHPRPSLNLNNYIIPARFLLNNGTNEALFAAGLLLLMAVDSLATIGQHKIGKKSGALFQEQWIKMFPVTERNVSVGRECFEQYPSDKDGTFPAEIVWKIFRSRAAHNGGRLDKNSEKDLGKWKDVYSHFVFVKRKDREDVPVFCLNPTDDRGQTKITLDVEKILKKLEGLVLPNDENNSDGTLRVRSSAANSV